MYFSYGYCSVFWYFWCKLSIFIDRWMLHSSLKQREPVIIVILIHMTRSHFTFHQQKSVQRSFLNSDVVCFSVGRLSGGNVQWPHFIHWRFYSISPINSFIYSVTKFCFRYHVNVPWLWILLFQMLAEANDLCCFVWMCMLLMYFFVSGHLSYLLLFFFSCLNCSFQMLNGAVEDEHHE